MSELVCSRCGEFLGHQIDGESYVVSVDVGCTRIDL